MRHLVLLGLVTQVNAGAWDDFSNNLATDLAPFLSLFGEQITKQYMSESISWLDYFIFAMAPMGILTALVSAIRVCGSSSLRAFIGRAQEGSGNAEAELCSSTSRDVCELYNNGGIARVFGRPKILEVVYDPHDPNFADGTAGIHTFQHYIQTDRGKSLWRRDSGPHSIEKGQNMEPDPEPFAPNLSLNVGIQRQPRSVFWAVALVGFILQAGVLVFASMVAYYLRWGKDKSPPESYGCPLTIIGTILVCSGTYLCAFLVGDSTDERVYRRNPEAVPSSQPASLFWIQPGGQVIGDQTFDTFASSDSKAPLGEYIVSGKNRSERRLKKAELSVWGAVSITVSGFVLQFIGLRAMHSAVSVAQLGATMAMSLARAALRMQRLKSEDNLLARCPDQVVGHELDWLALRIGQKDIEKHVSNSLVRNVSRRCSWRFTGTAEAGRRLRKEPPACIGTAGKIHAYRTRLAELTESLVTQGKSAVPTRNFRMDMVQVRKGARCLAAAMESTTNMIFSKSANIHHGWKAAGRLFWGFDCAISAEGLPTSTDMHPIPDQHRQTIYIEMTRQGKGPWSLRNKADLEALLGLWVWSLKADPVVETIDAQTNFTISRAADINSRRIIATRASSLTDLKMWLLEEPPGLTEAILSCKDSSFVRNPNHIWKHFPSPTQEDPGSLRPVSFILPRELDAQTMRLFGWPSTGQSSEDASKKRVWTVPTENTLEALCVQEAFSCFLASMVEVVQDFGRVEIHGEAGRFRLQNTLMSELTEIFIERGIGDRNEALLCLVPSIIPRINLPSSELALGAAKTMADHYRKQKDWGRAEDVLRWAWNVCLAAQPDHPDKCSSEDEDSQCSDAAGCPIEKTAIALGELYRWGLVERSENQFATKGIRWLGQQRGYVAAHPKACQAIDRYQAIATHDKIDRGVLFEAISKIKRFPEGRTALLACLTETERLSDNEKGQALLWAAAFDWTEIISALVELRAPTGYPDKDSNTPLFHAVINNNMAALNLLADAGADPNHTNRQQISPLAHASKFGYDSAVRRLIQERRVDLNARNSQGRSPLFYAVESNQDAVVKLLLDCGGVNVEMGHLVDRKSLLSFAAENGNLGIAKMLLDAGADEHSQDNYINEALGHAAKSDHPLMVRLLLDRCKVNLDAREALGKAALNGYGAIVEMLLDDERVDPNESNTNQPPLYQAISQGHEKVAMMLVNHSRIDLQALDRTTRDSALHVAARQGSEVILAALLDSGRVDVDFRNDKGRTALHLAALAGCYTTFEMLYKTGSCNIYTRDSNGSSLFQHAVVGNNARIVNLLLETGKFDPKSHSHESRSPLHSAVLEGNYELFKTLLGSFDPDYSDDKGDTLLHGAVKGGNLDIVRTLLRDLAVSPRSTNHDNWAPLHTAAERGHLEIVSLLLESGKADVDVRSGTGSCSTPLHLAVENEHSKVVGALLQMGKANPNVIDRRGIPPLYFAIQPGKSCRLELVKLLLDHNADANMHTEDIRKRTPRRVPLLNTAVWSGNAEVVRLLVDADQFGSSCKGENALHVAMKKVEPLRLSEILLSSGKFNPNRVDWDGIPALGLAIERWESVGEPRGQPQLVKLLCKYGANVNWSDFRGRTVLHHAAKKLQPDVVKAALETGVADTEAEDGSEGLTPLHHAVAANDIWGGRSFKNVRVETENRALQVIELLLTIGRAEPDRKSNGNTPFGAAAIAGRAERMQLLLHMGKVDANARGVGGNSPLGLATMHGKIKVVEFLVQTGKVDVNHRNDADKTPLGLIRSPKTKVYNKEGIEKILLDAGAEL